VNEPDLGLDGVPTVALGSAIQDLHAPQQLTGHFNLVVNVAADLLALGRHCGSHIVGIESSAGDSMDQLNDVTVPNNIRVISHHQVFLCGSLNQPPVVHILEGVASDLLLMGGAPLVRVAHRIYSCMRVQPAGASVGVAQCDLGAMYHRQRLPACDRCQPAIQRGLERTGHDAVMWSSPMQRLEVDVEDSYIDGQWNPNEDQQTTNGVHPQLAI